MTDISSSFDPLKSRLESGAATIGVVGLGYVGIPLALALHDAGYRVLGFDVNGARVAAIKAGQQVISYIPEAEIPDALATSRFDATDRFERLAEADAIIICVPTPLTANRDPDLSYIEQTARTISHYLRPGQLVVLESTTWPGTTREVVRPILEKSGLTAGQDFFLAYSPEREDPANRQHTTKAIPKVIGADDTLSLEAALCLYGKTVAQTVMVEGTACAEAVKLTENIFRAVNIALVNELKTVYSAMGIDVWDVIDAAATKPFGFMPFYPGPGLGGHCIPVDPFYLTWRAREFGVETRFVELAGKINTNMPRQVVEKLGEALDSRLGRGLNGAHVLLLGLAYKKNVDDTRESPSLTLIELIEARGAQCDYYDPYIPQIPPTREHAALAGRRSVALTPDALKAYDAVLVATDHDRVDYNSVLANSRVILDTRNVFARLGLADDRIIKA